jgi:hypothetical protein
MLSSINENYENNVNVILENSDIELIFAKATNYGQDKNY